MRLAKQQISYVDIEDIEVQLSAGIPDKSVDELYRFGEILFSDTRQTCSQIDTKLTSIPGWSTAALAFLLFDVHSKTSNFPKPFLIVAVLPVLLAVVFLAVVFSMWGLKSKLWTAPSEQDWFRDELLAESDRLTRYHVVSLLTSHQEHARINAAKANRLRSAEAALMLGAAIVALTLLYGVFTA